MSGSLMANGGIAYSISSVTPDDANDLPTQGVLYVGVGGDIKVTAANEGTQIFFGVPTGSILPVQVRRVWASDLTADSLVLLA